MYKLPRVNVEELSKINFISEETIEFHLYKHHKGYVDNLNRLLEQEPELSKLTLNDLILESKNEIFNNAAQVWNHTFFWKCIKTNKKQASAFLIYQKIDSDFGTIENFKSDFRKMCLSNFGSGWTWLVKSKKENKLLIMNTSNAMTPFKLSCDLIPMLVCDIWEHSYYIDYRNKRSDYVESFIKNIDWEWVNNCFIDEQLQELDNIN